jgi:peptide/nickel transport system substrate-binding protein
MPVLLTGASAQADSDSWAIMRTIAKLPCVVLTAAGISGIWATQYAFPEGRVPSGTNERFGGSLVVAQKVEPRTLNPLTALDVASREVIGLLHSDLIHINRHNSLPEPSVAESWRVSADGRTFTMRLRRGVRFSDGHPLDADDVVFTFNAHLDERVNSAQKETLQFGGKPITVRKIDPLTVEFTLYRRSASAERVFDGVAILPEHLLGPVYRRGEISNAWPLTVRSSDIAGLGPFRLKEHVPGQRLVLERNPYYWKVGGGSTRLPYLDAIVYEFLGSEEGQRLHFESKRSHVIPALTSSSFAALRAKSAENGYRVLNYGPGLEYSFLVFNQNDPKPGSDANVAAKRSWFRETAFRRAASAAIDRDAVARIAYGGLASPIWAHVSDGNRNWVNTSIPRPARSLDRARQILRSAGFTWNASGRLLDPSGTEVTFSMLTSAGNSQRTQTATIIQDDLRQLGIKVTIAALEFRSMLDRVFQTHEYEAAVMTLASGDTDPNSDMNVWTLKGNTRLWKLQSGSDTAWERELNELMHTQATARDRAARKRLYDRVQQIVAEQLPIICIASPHVLVAASADLENLRPSILRPYALGGVEELYFRKGQPAR